MLLLLVFAFLGGVVTILSPCILPILPVVLSGGVTGGKKRPIGVVTGFVLSFTFFTLFLTSLVRATGISADSLRSVSVFIVAAFGLGLLVPKFQIALERMFSRLAGNFSPRTQPVQTDFIAGFLIGISLGLVWTPCVGPILASIITLAATSSVGTGAVFITLAYAVGTAIPLLAVTYGGRSLLLAHPGLVKNAGNIQKLFGIFMIFTALAIYLNWDRRFQAYVLTKFPNYGVGLTKFEDNEMVAKELDTLRATPLQSLTKSALTQNYGPAPELLSGGRWFNLPQNQEPPTIRSLRGSVVLIDFWTYTCINCIRTLPYLKNWHAKYKDQGLVIIGVHTPEFEFEKNPENVEKAIADFAIKYPVMQDNEYATWTAYENRYWPAKYLVDKDGNIRYTHFGEGAYDETEAVIQELLTEAGSAVDQTIDNPDYRVQSRTPELYLGYGRIAYFRSPEKIQPDKKAAYTAPLNVPKNSFAFSGTWTVGKERAMPEKGASLLLRFDAKEVFLVMRPNQPNAAGGLKVYLDGIPVTTDFQGEDVINGNVKVTTDRLYKLINLPAPGAHTLLLEILDADIELYAFTFG